MLSAFVIAPDVSAEKLIKIIREYYPQLQVIGNASSWTEEVEEQEFHVLDCILTPFEAAEVVAKATLYRQHRMMLQQLQDIHQALNLDRKPCRPKRIPLPQNQYSVEYLRLNQITHIEAERQYCVFHTIDKRRITTSKNIGAYEKLLDDQAFMRVHRSHIVNLEHVRSFHRDREALELFDGSFITVTRNIREQVLSRLLEV